MTIGCRRGRANGFTLVEILVASSLAAIFMTAAALSYAAITQNQDEIHSFGKVVVGSTNLDNFFGSSAPKAGGATVNFRNVPWAPNYGKSAELEYLRDIFWIDVSSSSAVFCLARIGLNPYRPTAIPLSLGTDARTIDTPEKFFSLVNGMVPGVFNSYRCVPGSAAKNGSIFILQPSSNPYELNVRAIYEIDFVSTSSPTGTYVAIRRYEGSALTGQPFELFYQIGSGTQSFGPLFVAFERRGRLVHSEADYNRFKKAANRPFYFLWWPDPADKYLEPMPYGTVPTYNTSTDPRADYRLMSGRSAFLFVVPMFPAL